MDENLSWRAKLAKSNINILDIHDYAIFIEFTYHPKPGTFKWCKTVYPYVEGWEIEKMADTILKHVLELRKELEA